MKYQQLEEYFSYRYWMERKVVIMVLELFAEEIKFQGRTKQIA